MTWARSRAVRTGTRQSPFAPSGGMQRQSEPVVPMINVVFLLLIFFLMTAEIAPPDPFDVEIPTTATTDAASAGDTLYLSASGEIAFGTLRGAPAIAAAAKTGEAILNLRADARAEASTLARLLADLARAGATNIALITRETGR